MVPPILTLLLLLSAILLGTRVPSLLAALPLLVLAWALVMVVNFVVAGVADDGDVAAFVGSSLVVLLLCVGLWKVGERLGRGRRIAR